MGVQVKGMAQLRSRFEALKPSPTLMRDLALAAVREQKKKLTANGSVRTGNLRRSINVGRVTSTSAETIARANYAAPVELGSRPHTIVPRRARVLRFKPAGGQVVFARRVRHPGTRAQPFMVPGARAAVESLGAESFVRRWDGAA